MPQNPITAWHEINDGLYDIAYAKTLINLKHDKILYSSTLGKLIDPILQTELNVFKEIIKGVPAEQKKEWERFADAMKKDPVRTQQHIEMEWKQNQKKLNSASNVQKDKNESVN